MTRMIFPALAMARRFAAATPTRRKSTALVLVEEAAGMKAGEFHQVEIVDCSEHDLWGVRR